MEKELKPWKPYSDIGAIIGLWTMLIALFVVLFAREFAWIIIFVVAFMVVFGVILAHYALRTVQGFDKKK